MKYGVLGIEALVNTVEYIADVAQGVMVILDAKFGDIDNTNLGYASFAFDQVKADALTIHSYMGQGANQVFLDHADKMFFVLCHTSNNGAGEFQDLHLPFIGDKYSQMVEAKKRLYVQVAFNVAKKWNSNYNCGLVTGATAPDEIAEVRKVAPLVPLLVPGIGAQGGKLQKSVENALIVDGGFLLNDSRKTLFASSGEDFAEAAAARVDDLNTQIHEAISAVKSQKGWS